MRVADAIASCLAGDRAAFDVVVTTHADELVAFLARLLGHLEDARDIAQETFVRAYLNLHRYDPHRPFKPWLFRIGRNLAYNHLKSPRSRAERHAARFADDAFSAPEGETSNPSQAVWNSERRRAVDAVLCTMRPQFREVLLLRYLHRMEYEEIAAAMGIPSGTVKTWLHRAKEQFRKRADSSGVF